MTYEYASVWFDGENWQIEPGAPCEEKGAFDSAEDALAFLGSRGFRLVQTSRVRGDDVDVWGSTIFVMERAAQNVSNR